VTTVPIAWLARVAPPLGLLDIGPVELLILAAAAVMLFGGDLPDMARRAGRMLGRLRASAQELTREVEPPADLGQLPPPGDPHAPPPRHDGSPADGREESADS
jgi:Sec-independent protein translocase protein TatA